MAILIHQYFIKKGQLGLEQAKEISFQKKTIILKGTKSWIKHLH